MKAKVIGLDGTESAEIELPAVFDTPYRPEVIHKVYVNVLSHSYQRQGRYPAAGEMVSAESRNTGLGIARLARARGEGFPRAGQGCRCCWCKARTSCPPPRVLENHLQKNQPQRKTTRSLLCNSSHCQEGAGTRRGHKIGNEVKLPLVVSNEIESIAKTKDLKNVLIRLGLGDDIARASLARKARSGTPRRRGRSTRSGTSALIIVGDDSKVVALSRSIPGIDIKHARNISIVDLVPGSKPIRLTIFSQRAIEYMKSVQAPMHKLLEVIRK